MVSDTYATRLIDKERRAAEFDELGELVATVPSRMVRPRADIRELRALCQQIVDDFRALQRNAD